MAESSSSALPGGVEWLPTLGGAHLLRAEVRGEPPVLVLHTTEGEEHRVEPGPQARYDGSTTYMVPAGLAWSRASLMWPDGTRAVLPMQADVIKLPRREPVSRSLPRPEPLPWMAPPWAGATDTELATAAWAARRATFEQELASAADAVARVAESERETRDAVLAVLDSARSDVQAARAAQADEVALLAEIAEELDAERATRDALAEELEAERVAHEAADAAHEATRGTLVQELEAERDAHGSTRGALDAERAAHAETRGTAETLAEALANARAELEAARAVAGDGASVEALRAELAAARAQAELSSDSRAHLASARRDAALARAEVATLRADLEAERAARVRAEEALREAGDGTAYLERVAKLDRDVEGLRTQVRLERRAREQAEAAAAAARRPPAETGRLLANLDAAAAALRATTEPLDDAEPQDAGSAAAPPANGVAFGTAAPPANGAVFGASASPGNAVAFDAAAPPANGAVFGASASPGNAAAFDAAAPPANDTAFASAAPVRDAGAAPPARAVAPAAAAPLPGTAWPAGAALDSGATPAANAAAAARAAAEAVVAAALPGSAISASPTMYRAAPTALAGGRRDRCLRLALVGLAAEDPVAAGTLLAGLLPAQGAVIEQTLTYDLTVRGIGTFAVFVADGAVRIQRISRPRGRGESAFHLSAEPQALAELLAGDQRKIRRLGRSARYSGRRKQLRTLAALPTAALSLADAVRAGARLEPWLVYRALPFAIPAEWTRGHVFTVAQEVVELTPRAWYITARDGVALNVTEHAAGAAADATVTMSRNAFDRLLRGEPALDGDRPLIRGDHAAVATLKRWTDLARGD